MVSEAYGLSYCPAHEFLEPSVLDNYHRFCEYSPHQNGYIIVISLDLSARLGDIDQ